MGRIHVSDACASSCDDPETQMVVPKILIGPVRIPMCHPNSGVLMTPSKLRLEMVGVSSSRTK